MTPLALILLFFGSAAYAQDSSTMLVLDVTAGTTAMPSTVEHSSEATTVIPVAVVVPVQKSTVLPVVVESVSHGTTLVPMHSSIIMTSIATTIVPVHSHDMHNDQPNPVVAGKTKTNGTKTGKGHGGGTTKTVKAKTTPAIRNRPTGTTDMPVTKMVVHSVNKTEGMVNVVNASQETQGMQETTSKTPKVTTTKTPRNRRQFIGGLGGGFGNGFGGGFGGGVIPAGGMVQSQVSQPFGFGGPVVQDTVSVEDTIVGRK